MGGGRARLLPAEEEEIYGRREEHISWKYIITIMT